MYPAYAPQESIRHLFAFALPFTKTVLLGFGMTWLAGVALEIAMTPRVAAAHVSPPSRESMPADDAEKSRGFSATRHLELSMDFLTGREVRDSSMQHGHYA